MIDVASYGPVTVVRLEHGKVNALDLELLTGIATTMRGLPDTAAVVLTGTGSVFCAGVDLRRIVAGGPAYVGQFWPALTEAFLAVFDHPGPVLAAVNGHAIAGGCVLAAACDVRLMSSGTIGLTELLVGVPFPTSAMEIMRHAVGAAAGPLALTGRPVSSVHAHRIGLVDDVVEPERLFDEAMARAESMAAIPAAAYAMTKRQLHAPARQRIEAGRADDEAAGAIWAAPHTLAAISGYLERLGSRRS